MSERLLQRVMPLVVVLGLGAVGCGESTKTREVNTKTTVVTGSGVTITQIYTEDGRRITRTNGFSAEDVFDYCDGPDLVERTEWTRFDTSGLARSPNHPACADGRLDPADFALTPTVTIHN